jgi:circadian clock protein KaiB
MGKNVAFKFRLYVAGDAPNSVQAVANLRAVCHELLRGHHEIEIVDVLSDPKRALADGIVLTPTLVKFSPAPLRKIAGTLSQRQLLLQALQLSIETL